MSKTHAMFIAVVIVFCGCVQVTAQVPAVTSSPNDRELLLIERIEKLERRLAELEAKLNTNASSSIDTTPPAEIKTTPLSQTDKTDRDAFDFLSDTSFNLTFDGYYGYNFNRPVGGVNLLRAYDVTANSFSVNQAALVIENAPNLEKGKRYGFRLDLQQRDRNPVLNPTFATLLTQPGLSTDVVRPVPSGRFHVLDTYYTFAVNDKWTFAVESDYMVGRVFRESAPATVWDGAGYANYQWTPKFALRGRLEYLAEKVSAAGGLFSGVPQALKEGTFTAEYKLADGFLVRGEYRRDWSNQPFFLTEQPGVLKKEQNTATLGLVWWFGRKQGTW